VPESLTYDQAQRRAHRRLIVTVIVIAVLGVVGFLLSWQPWASWALLVMVVIDLGLLLGQARGNRADRKRTIYGAAPGAPDIGPGSPPTRRTPR
jgi:uncharacterized membrane protein YdbT with pleckstrin-like domain